MLLIAQDDRGKITFYYHLMIQGKCLEEAVGDTFLWQAEDSRWRAGEGLCDERGSLLAPTNLHSWHIQLHWALESLGIFFRLPLTPSSLELGFLSLISFHFL